MLLFTKFWKLTTNSKILTFSRSYLKKLFIKKNFKHYSLKLVYNMTKLFITGNQRIWNKNNLCGKRLRSTRCRRSSPRRTSRVFRPFPARIIAQLRLWAESGRSGRPLVSRHLFRLRVRRRRREQSSGTCQTGDAQRVRGHHDVRLAGLRKNSLGQSVGWEKSGETVHCYWQYAVAGKNDRKFFKVLYFLNFYPNLVLLHNFLQLKFFFFKMQYKVKF